MINSSDHTSPVVIEAKPDSICSHCQMPVSKICHNLSSLPIQTCCVQLTLGLLPLNQYHLCFLCESTWKFMESISSYISQILSFSHFFLLGPENQCYYLTVASTFFFIKLTYFIVGMTEPAGRGGESRGGTSYSSFIRWPFEKTWKAHKYYNGYLLLSPWIFIN